MEAWESDVFFEDFWIFVVQLCSALHFLPGVALHYSYLELESGVATNSYVPRLGLQKSEASTIFNH